MRRTTQALLVDGSLMNRTSRNIAKMIAACLLSQAASAWATVGGPEVATILGWNPVEKRIYYKVNFVDESGRPPRIYFLDLGSSHPGDAVPLRLWPEKEDPIIDYPSVDSKIEALRKRLVPLPASASDTLVMSITTRAVQEDWRNTSGDIRSKYELEILISAESLKGSARVRSFCNREVLIKEWYKIPELPFAIVNVSYTGSPEETCYARPAVLLLTAGR